MRDVRSYTPMKKIVLALLLALSVALLVTACDSGKKEEGANGKPVAESSSSAPKAETAVQAQAVEEATPPPSPEELDRADRLVAFSNAASMALATGRFAQADVLAAYTKYYLAEWQLAKRPELNADQDAALARRLTPPVSLFTPEQAKKMTACVQDMLQAAQQLEGIVQIVSSASEALSEQIAQSSRGADEQSGRVRETATAMRACKAALATSPRNPFTYCSSSQRSACGTRADSNKRSSVWRSSAFRRSKSARASSRILCLLARSTLASSSSCSR